MQLTLRFLAGCSLLLVVYRTGLLYRTGLFGAVLVAAVGICFLQPWWLLLPYTPEYKSGDLVLTTVYFLVFILSVKPSL